MDSELGRTLTTGWHVRLEFLRRWGRVAEFDDLPAKARDYVLRLEELSGAHVSCIGVGPGRDQTIVRRDILAARP